MTKIIFNENGILNLGAISKEEDLIPKCRILVNCPPMDGRCEVCGRHMSELKPFGGPGDPLLGDFTGKLLVKIWRRLGPYDEEAIKAVKEAEKAIKEASDSNDLLSWLIRKYGEEKGEKFYYTFSAWDCIGSSWECRDCIILDDDEYFERLDQRYQEHGNE